VRSQPQSSPLYKVPPLHREYSCQDRVGRIASIQSMTIVNSGPISDVHSLITVQMKEDAQKFTVVDIRSILGLAHLMPVGDQHWIVNIRIDLRIFNQVY